MKTKKIFYMNKKMYFSAVVPLFALCCTACAGDVVTIKYNGAKVEVSKVEPSDSVKIMTDGANVTVENLAKQKTMTYRLSGKSDNGTFILKTSNKDKIELDDLTLQSNEGAPIWLKNKKKVEIQSLRGTKNTLTITACKDTANLKAAVIYAKNKLLLSGSGSLDVLASGDGCKGINAKNDITIEDVTLNIQTTGNNLGPDNRGFGGFGGFGGPGFGPGPDGPMGGPGFPGFNPDDMPEEMKKHFEEMRKMFENGEFPPMGGFGGPMGGFGGPMGGFGGQGMQAGPPEGEGPEDANEGGGFKQKYLGTCKGIKSTDKVTINSGNVTVYTKSAGAEGIEGKKGVIINGGNVNVNSKDDGINATAAIYFNGGKTTVISRANDAVDANPEGGFMFPGMFGGGEGEQKERESLIFINGGEVHAYSWVGSPEEGLDCDFNPIEVNGGTAFSIGAGMGDMPSVPTAKTAHQPTALIVGLTVKKDLPITLKDKQGKTLFTTPAPFSFNNSSSLLTCPDLKVGESYVIECGEYKREFEMKEKFNVVR